MSIGNDHYFDVTIIGAGVAGIASAYYLSQQGLKVALIDKLSPLSFTSAQSGENYRNWWPHPTITDFTNHSIQLMEELSQVTDNCLLMTRRGYLLASRDNKSDELIKQLYEGYGSSGERQIRLHDNPGQQSYVPALSSDWETSVDGVDVIHDKSIIQENYPYLDPDVNLLIHIRRAGEISFHPLGQFMLSKIRANGGRLFQGTIKYIEHAENTGFTISHDFNGEKTNIYSSKLVNAAGPFATEIAKMLGVNLPLKNILQQKIAFEDINGSIPRDMPFVVDLDDCILEWDKEDQEILANESETRWLTEPISGGIHCRPDGGNHGRWIKLGWAFNKKISTPSWEPELDPLFPDLVLRGASRLNPALKKYLGRLPRNFAHYGGYYSMTDENWPIIGPMGIKGAYVVGALSGFGTMTACGAGALITSWIMGDTLPKYASQLSLERYADHNLMQRLKTLSTGSL